MKKQTKKTFKTTPEIAELLQVVLQLEEAKNHVMKPVGIIFKRYDGKAVSEVAEAVAIATQRLWNLIYAVYPEVKDVNTKWQCSFSEIVKL